MTAHALKDVLARLPLLSRPEREEVRGRLDMLTARHVTVVGEVYQWLMHALGGKGFPPLPTIMKSSQSKRFRHGAETLDAFISEVFGTVATRTRQRLMLLLIQCVLADLKEKAERVSPASIAYSLANLWSIVEARFPGYMECGLLAEALTDKEWE